MPLTMKTKEVTVKVNESQLACVEACVDAFKHTAADACAIATHVTAAELTLQLRNLFTHTPSRKFHGWVLVESGGKDYKDYVFVEYTNKEGHRIQTEMAYRGESGCAAAVEWWDKHVGQPVKLQPILRGTYRVYTEEV